MRPGKAERLANRLHRERMIEARSRAALVIANPMPLESVLGLRESRFLEKATAGNTSSVYHRWTGDGGLVRAKPGSTKRWRQA